MQQYVGFYIGQAEYMVPILEVREIINIPTITRMPLTPPYIEGVTNLRGSVLPLVNLKKLMRLDGTNGKTTNHNGDGIKGNVVVITQGGMIFGVLVDGISGIISVEESDIEPIETVLNKTTEQIKGVAKVDGRLAILLDPRQLLPLEDLSALDDLVVDVKEVDGGKVEVTKKIQTMGGETMIKELKEANEFFGTRVIDSTDPRYIVFNDIIDFMNAITNQDYDEADNAVQNIMKKGQDELFKEVGKITRTLHDTIRGFKQAIDPRLKDMAVHDIPSTVESLEFVIAKSEEAANKTMGIVEKYILNMDELSEHIRKLSGPEESVKYLEKFKNGLEDDLTEVLTTQSFQDLTGQLIKKVIKLVGDIEGELVRLVTTFGVKIETSAKVEAAPEKVNQSDVDDLLKEFGF